MQGKKKELLWLSETKRIAVWISMMTLAFVIAGCAAKATISEAPTPNATIIDQGPSVARLENGQQGFVIRESAKMDGESRSEFERAVSLMNEGQNDKAIELLTKIIERKPGVTAPYINIAVAYMRMNRPEQAEQNLKTALGLVPAHPTASNEYGMLLRKAGRFKEARAVYEEEIARFPEYLPVHKNLGILCDLYLNDPVCALKQFEIYSEGMPSDPQVKTWIAELRMRPGHQSEERR
jgi:Tfp pilus assembly protein PilF